MLTQIQQSLESDDVKAPAVAEPTVPDSDSSTE
jgi:hypothetical protein